MNTAREIQDSDDERPDWATIMHWVDQQRAADAGGRPRAPEESRDGDG